MELESRLRVLHISTKLLVESVKNRLPFTSPWRASCAAWMMTEARMQAHALRSASFSRCKVELTTRVKPEQLFFIEFYPILFVNDNHNDAFTAKVAMLDR